MAHVCCVVRARLQCISFAASTELPCTTALSFPPAAPVECRPPLTTGCCPQVWCEVFLRDDGKPLSLDHYHGIYIGLEKLKIVSCMPVHALRWLPALTGCLPGFGLLLQVAQAEAGSPAGARGAAKHRSL